jgi:hypothetical protein
MSPITGSGTVTASLKNLGAALANAFPTFGKTLQPGQPIFCKLQSLISRTVGG